MISVAVLGSTGSIGTQTLEVIASEPERFRVASLSAHGSVEAVAAQATAVRPESVVLTDGSRAAELAELLPAGVALEVGPEALEAVAADDDVVINGVVVFAGLGVTLATLNAGKRLGLANKESLIAGGPVVQRARATPGAELVPVDSEHCAIHQCLRANDVPDRLARVVLTASGGPFRGRSIEDLSDVTVEDALAHPTWSMGPKITIDSSTLMNKGLEVIEARWLFAVDPEQIEVVVHPQSIVHSLVEFRDGSVVAQMGIPDMRIPIAYALSYPERLDLGLARLNLAQCGGLVFEPPDEERFPALRLACDALAAGGVKPAVLNAANEVAVAAFLDGRITFAAIAATVAAALDQVAQADDLDLQAILDADRAARTVAARLVQDA